MDKEIVRPAPVAPIVKRRALPRRARIDTARRARLARHARPPLRPLRPLDEKKGRDEARPKSREETPWGARLTPPRPPY